MNFCIITHVNHYQEQNKYFAYAPYVREMNIWLKNVDTVTIVAPLEKKEKSTIDSAYTHAHINFSPVPSFDVTGIKQIAHTIINLPFVFYVVFKAMQKADHIHLRCPGNMGLIGAMVQMFFPNKAKTAKYAGNWDPNSKQPWSYRLQKGLLSNTFLTRNMQVLVYGAWPNQTKNIKSFFTATYAENEKKVIPPRSLEGIIYFVFVGTLSPGKQPLYAVQMVEQLHLKGFKVLLELYGEGVLRHELEQYILMHKLQDVVILKGNQTKETIEKAYQESHFLALPSKSEGWPKVIAEAMFWGCVPVVTPISCVPYMVANGERGVLLLENLKQDVTHLEDLLENAADYTARSIAGTDWSRQFTTDVFEAEIQQLLRT